MPVRKKRITKKVLVTKTIETLQPWLSLSDWKILVKFSSRMKTAADCEAFPEYKQAVIRFNPEFLTELSYYEVISLAVHEMCHCVVWPFSEWTEGLCRKNAEKLEVTRKLEEGLITNLEKIITDMSIDIIQGALTEENYSTLDLTFKEFEICNEP
jgi:hypothetical protein